MSSRLRSQALFGWRPSPGTAFYAGYNDDLNYDTRHPFTREIVPGFRRNSRTVFIKMSYLIRRGFCARIIWLARPHVNLHRMSNAVKVLLCLMATLFVASCKSDYQASQRQGARPGDAKASRPVR